MQKLYVARRACGCPVATVRPFVLEAKGTAKIVATLIEQGLLISLEDSIDVIFYDECPHVQATPKDDKDDGEQLSMFGSEPDGVEVSVRHIDANGEIHEGPPAEVVAGFVRAVATAPADA